MLVSTRETLPPFSAAPFKYQSLLAIPFFLLITDLIHSIHPEV
jgi:hypothetical protein